MGAPQKPPSGADEPDASAPRGRGQRRRRSIGFYLVAVIALQAVLFSGLTIAAGLGDYSDESNHAAASSERTAKLAADLIAKSVEVTRTQMASEAALPGYDAVFGSPADCVLTGGGTDAFAEADIHLIGLDGSVPCSSLKRSGGVGGRSYADSAWLDDVKAADVATPVIFGPVGDPLTHKDVLIVAAKLTGTDGAIVTALHLDSLAGGLANQLGRGDPSFAFIVTTKDRRTVLSGPASRLGDRLDGTPFARPIRPTAAVFRDLDGTERIYGTASVDDLGWHVWAGASSNDVLADARSALRETLLLGFGALIVVLIVGALIRRRIVRPVRTLAEAVDEAAEGNLTSRVPTGGPRELANLGERFNNMLEVRARSEETLVAAYEKERSAAESLRELDAMKSGFLMAISHELRTPLTAVVGYASLLEDPDSGLSDEERADSTRRIASQARRLERLLVDLLDVERMSRGTIEAHRREVDLRALVVRVIDQSAGAKRVRVTVPARLQVSVDAGLMERVTENLVVNAIKHTPPTTDIVVRATRNRDGVVLIVDDTGPGVPDDMKTEIFEAFRQGEVPDHAPGTGIGLALVKQFAKLHGGDAWVEDRPGGGASFRVSLPADGAPKPPRKVKAPRRAAEVAVPPVPR